MCAVTGGMHCTAATATSQHVCSVCAVIRWYGWEESQWVRVTPLRAERMYMYVQAYTCIHAQT